MANYFFGLEVLSNWPENMPKGRFIEKKHLTLAFLGKNSMESPILPSFKVAPVAKADKIIFLPAKTPHVVALEVSFFDNRVINFQKELTKEEFFLPHVTLCREPFDKKAWEDFSIKLPLVMSSFNLYESMGNSQYEVRWSHPFLMPFEEFEHTADIAFRVRGDDFSSLFLHGAMALAFECPSILDFIEVKKLSSLEEVVRELNELIYLLDIETGAPFKAVSYHGEVKVVENIFEWEMVVDV